MMPMNPNQEPKDGQKYPLDTNRVTSSIPKGGTENGTWTYPSEQMFFNALRRKGKGDDVHEGHINTIVHIHNNMNERAWDQVAAWEETCHPGYLSIDQSIYILSISICSHRRRHYKRRK
jgi:cytochrome c heme-lyase